MQELPWGMTPVGIGERLRNAREALGLSLEEIESVTRIRRLYLEALEQEAFDKLPAPAYVRGFLRAYAAYLGIPPEDVLELYPSTRWVGSHGDSPVEVRITPATRFSHTREVLMGAGVLLVLGAVLLGMVLYGQIRQFAESPPSPQGPAVSPAGPGSPSAAVPPRSSLPSASPVDPNRAGPLPPTAAAPAIGAPVGPPASRGAGPVPGTAPGAGATPASGSAPGPGASALPGKTPGPIPAPAAAPRTVLHVAVVASGRSWVRTVVDGTTVFEGFLNPGDRQVWEAGRTLTLRVGNASAVDIALNGQPLGPLGGPGAVYEHTFASGSNR